MKQRFITIILCLCSFTMLAMGQATRCTVCNNWNCKIEHKKCPTCGEWDYKCHYNCNHPVQKCSICGKAKCPQKGKHTVCPTCKKYDFQCKYNFNHPCKQCGRTSCSTKDKHKVCPTCKKYDFQCEYNLSHPCSQCGKEDCKTKNKHEKCPTCGEYDFKCSYKFNHPCSQCGSKDCKKKDKHEKCTTCGEYDFNCRFNCQHPEYVDLGLSVKWATCNVGATRPEEYGDYFAWGETKPQDVYSWDTYKWCSNGSWHNMNKYTYADGTKWGIWYKKKKFVGDNENVLNFEDDAAHVNLGGAWRMPTLAEQNELYINCSWTWTSQNGVNGYKVVGPNSNYIFLPAAGYRCGDRLYEANSRGFYWSSSLTTSLSEYRNLNSGFAFYLLFSSSSVFWNSYNRYYGQSVRAVCE